MKTLVAKAGKLVLSERAATTTEYAVLLALMLVVFIAAIGNLGTTAAAVHSANAAAVP